MPFLIYEFSITKSHAITVTKKMMMMKIYSKHLHSQIVRARELKFWAKVHFSHLSFVPLCIFNIPSVAWAVLQSPLSLIISIIQSSFRSVSSRQCRSHMSHVRCKVSYVTCHVPGVTCNFCFTVVELVGGGSVINRGLLRLVSLDKVFKIMF